MTSTSRAVNGDVPEDSQRQRQQRIAGVVAQLFECGATGQPADAAALIASHPELMPELGEELSAAISIQEAGRAAARAGALDQPLEPLGMDELDEPLLVLSRDVAPGMEECPVSIQGYRMIGEISRGGQAVVYKAVQEATGRPVAVKILGGGQSAASVARVRFDREVLHLAQLSHPNIVGIIDRGRTASGDFYLAMDFVDGPTLDEYFKARRPLVMREVLAVFGKILKALAEAHRSGIVHRDLKPANVRVDPHGEPQLLDFGLARLIAEEQEPISAMPTITLPNQLVGSVPWASPEQACGEPVDQRSDIYSFGFMLYYVVKGAFPFPAENLLETLKSIAKASHAPLDSGFPALDALVARCLQRRPCDRYQSAAEVMCDLGKVGNRPASRWRMWGRRWAIPGCIIALVTAIICSIGYLRGSGGSNSGRPERPAVAPRITNDAGMELVLIRRGFFMMGSPVREDGRNGDERQHPVELTYDFYLGRTEVTVRQYRTVMGGTTPSATPDDDRAVGGVSWNDAMEFCRRLGEREGRKYRLCTEAEWEYACRAGTSDAFGVANAETAGWFGLLPPAEAPRVASKAANAWGLYDMHGGVAEWCLTGYHAYSSQPAQDPRPSITRTAVVRGGSYRSDPAQCRAAARRGVDPATRDALIGFRVLLELP